MDKLNLSKHISNAYNDELQTLHKRILGMGGLIDEQIADAFKALGTDAPNCAERVISKEEQVNQMQVDIDALCMQIIARRNPAASDLRLIIACLRIVSDMERVGDELKTVAMFSKRMGRSITDVAPPLLACETQLRQMLSDCLTAIVRQDPKLALEAARRDTQVNELYKSALDDLIGHMREQPEDIDDVVGYNRTLRAIERSGDHCRNIAEQVIYLVKGIDVRHVSLGKMAKAIGEEQADPQPESDPDGRGRR